MPELPEVETLKRELQRAVVGKTVARVLIAQPRVIRYPSAAAFAKGLAGVTFTGVRRRAKLLIIELSSGAALVVHLKMTGQLVLCGTGKASKVRFVFTDGTSLDFNDQRLFGELRLMRDWRSLPFVRALGPEPFEVSLPRFKKMLARRTTRIKPLLMDQTFLAGVGNLYAAECLFRAKIYPGRPAQSLSEQEAERLLRALHEVLREAIRCGGSSIDDYIRLSGKPGGYARRHLVYARHNKPCFVCKTLIQRTALGGRGTYFCPTCQQ